MNSERKLNGVSAAKSSYVGVSGSYGVFLESREKPTTNNTIDCANNIFYKDKGVKIASMIDGTSNTVVFSERCDQISGTDRKMNCGSATLYGIRDGQYRCA